MENPTSPDDHIGKASNLNKLEGVPKIDSPSATAIRQSKATSDNPSKHDSMVRERSDIELNHRQVSMPVSLEPPLVVRRPPKIKSDSFGLGSFSLFFWNRTEKKDMSSYSRSTHQSYTQETTFRLLGFNMTKNITYEISDGGFNTAVESIRFVSKFYRTHRVQMLRPASQRSLLDRSAAGDALSCVIIPSTPASAAILFILFVRCASIIKGYTNLYTLGRDG